jgi:hypothetical protein
MYPAFETGGFSFLKWAIVEALRRVFHKLLAFLA